MNETTKYRIHVGGYALDLTMDQIQTQAKKHQDHARGCKADLDKCKGCKGSQQFFAALPPLVLSRVLA